MTQSYALRYTPYCRYNRADHDRRAKRRGAMALPVRYKLIGLLALGSMINYADRMNISVAAPVIMPALG